MKNNKFKDLYETLFNPKNESNTEEKDEEEYKKINEKIENYKKIYEDVSNLDTLKTMLPKSYSYIPTTQDYVQKLTGSLQSYLNNKISNKQKNYSAYFKNNNEKVNEIIPNLNIKFTNIPNISYQKNIDFYENLCRGLLSQKQYDLALEIADNYVRYYFISIFMIIYLYEYFYMYFMCFLFIIFI